MWPLRRGADEWSGCRILTECVWYGLICIKMPNERKVMSAVTMSCALLPDGKKDGTPTTSTWHGWGEWNEIESGCAACECCGETRPIHAQLGLGG